MTNSYYVKAATIARNTNARAEPVNQEFQSIQEGFEKLPDPEQLNGASTSHATDTGTANAYVVSITGGPANPTAGTHAAFFAVNANTGASTLTYAAWDAKAIKRGNGDALVAGDIAVGQLVELRYSGSYWALTGATNQQLVAADISATAAASSATTAAGSATAAATSASAAATSEGNAALSATGAAGSATNAATSATAATTAQSAAETARTAAETARTAAQTAETNSASSASAAGTSATAAAGSATSAGGSATAAAGSATTASTAATNAATSEGTASSSASSAATSETNAAASAASAAAIVAAGLDLPGLGATTESADDDLVAIYDVSAPGHRKITKANFVAGLGGGGAFATGTAVTLSSDASVEFSLSSTVDEFVFIFQSVKPVTNNVNLLISASTDSGSNYNVSSDAYLIGGKSDGNTVTGYGNPGQTTQNIHLSGLSNDANGVGLSGELRIRQLSGGRASYDFRVVFNGHEQLAAEFWRLDTGTSSGGGSFLTSSRLTNIRFAMSSGNLASGYIIPVILEV